MFNPEDVLEGAREIRPHLAELLGSDAEQVDQELAALLAQDKAGQQVDEQILELVKSHEATLNWMGEFLSQPVLHRDYQRSPGTPQAIFVQKYVCPEGDWTWYRRAGEPMQTCRTHGDLVPVEES